MAAEDLMGVKLIDVWQFDRFPSGTRVPTPGCFENIEWRRMGETWCRADYIFTFFYLFYCFPSSHHHSHQILWVCNYLFCPDETLHLHQKGPKNTFKDNLVCQN